MSSRIIAVLATVTGLALVPGVASADGKHRHHHHHHHAHKARVKVFTSRDTASGDSTDPNAPAPAGQVTIASFTGGKLTLQLADGTTSGRVTSRTEIKCDATAAPATVRSHGDDEGDAPDQQQSGQPDQSTQSDQQRQSGQEQDGDDDANGDAGDDDSGQAAGCDQSALVAGAVVSRAKLEISGGVATFDEIELAAPAS